MAMRPMRKEICSVGRTRSRSTRINPHKDKYEETKTARAEIPTRKCISELRRSTNTHWTTLWERKERDIKKRRHPERIGRNSARIGADIIAESRKTQNRADQAQRTRSTSNMEETHHIKGSSNREEEEKNKQQKQQQATPQQAAVEEEEGNGRWRTKPSRDEAEEQRRRNKTTHKQNAGRRRPIASATKTRKVSKQNKKISSTGTAI